MNTYFVMHSAYTSSSSGMTLVELLISLAIMSILLGFGLPSFRAIYERWQVTQAARAMESSFRLARSESIKRGGHVGIRKIDNEINGCQNATTSREWGCGWLVYADQNSSGSWEAQHDTLLQEFRPDASVNVLRSANGSNLNFNRYGMVNLNAIGFTFLPQNPDSISQTAQTLCISSGGRMRSVHATSCR